MKTSLPLSDKARYGLVGWKRKIIKKNRTLVNQSTRRILKQELKNLP